MDRENSTRPNRHGIGYIRARAVRSTPPRSETRLEGSGAGLRSVSRPLFDRLLNRVRAIHPAPDPLTTATALWVGVHGIAVLSTTGALTLATPGVDIDALVEREVRDAVG